jgi:hypothetical protein
METDVRESLSNCILASGKGLGSGGETSHPMSLKRPFPHPGNALYNSNEMELLLLAFRNNDPADFAGAVPSIIFAVHHHLRLNYDGLIDLLHSFHLVHKVALLGF